MSDKLRSDLDRLKRSAKLALWMTTILVMLTMVLCFQVFVLHAKVF